MLELQHASIFLDTIIFVVESTIVNSSRYGLRQGVGVKCAPSVIVYKAYNDVSWTVFLGSSLNHFRQLLIFLVFASCWAMMDMPVKALSLRYRTWNNWDHWARRRNDREHLWVLYKCERRNVWLQILLLSFLICTLRSSIRIDMIFQLSTWL